MEAIAPLLKFAQIAKIKAPAIPSAMGKNIFLLLLNHAATASARAEGNISARKLARVLGCEKVL